MKKLTEKEIKKILSRVYWDADADLDYLYSLLNEEKGALENKKEINFYCRLLLSCDWYTLLKLVPLEKIKIILSDTVINRLYPKDIKKRFLYAREVLSR